MIQVVYCLCSLMNVIVMVALVRSVGNKIYYYYYYCSPVWLFEITNIQYCYINLDPVRIYYCNYVLNMLAVFTNFGVPL